MEEKICSLCEIRMLSEGEVFCHSCFPKLKRVFIKYANGIREFKRGKRSFIQMTLEFPKGESDEYAGARKATYIARGET